MRAAITCRHSRRKLLPRNSRGIGHRLCRPAARARIAILICSSNGARVNPSRRFVAGSKRHLRTIDVTDYSGGCKELPRAAAMILSPSIRNHGASGSVRRARAAGRNAAAPAETRSFSARVLPPRLPAPRVESLHRWSAPSLSLSPSLLSGGLSIPRVVKLTASLTRGEKPRQA